MSSTTPIDFDREHAAELVKTILENKDFHNVQLVAELDEKKISVNRCVMAASSEYFRVLLGPNFKEGKQEEVTLTGVDGPTLQLIIDFCYSGHIQISQENFHQVLDAASPMGLERVKQKCERFGVDNLNITYCLDLFLAAKLYALDELRAKSWDLICNRFEALPVSQLCEMPSSFITDLLKSDQINAREDLIFQRLVHWITKDEKERSQHASELLKLIHMEKLTLSVFHCDVNNFAEKFGCTDLVVIGHRRRDKSDGLSTNLYRSGMEDVKHLYAVSHTSRMISIHKYYPITDRWARIRDISIGSIWSHPSQDKSYGLTIANDNLYLISNGAYSKTTMLDIYPLYKMEHKNRECAKIERSLYSPIFHEDKIFIFGGFYNDDVLDTCEKISVFSDMDVLVSSMNFCRCKYACTLLDKNIYVVGGEGNAHLLLRSAECYDTGSGYWTGIADMIHPRADFAVVEWNGMLYAMGAHPAVERYDPIRNMWTEIGSCDGSNEVIRAVNWQNEIYVAMKNGRFGKFIVEPTCTFLPLRNSPFSSDLEAYLFIN